MKVFVGKYTLNRLSVMTDTGRKNFLESKEIYHCTETCVLHLNKIDKIVMFMYEEMKTLADVSKNPKF